MSNVRSPKVPHIRTSNSLAELAALALAVTSEAVEIVLVPDCGLWAQQKGVQLGSRSPRAMAVRRQSDGQALVVMRAEYEQEHLDDQAAALLIAGWRDQATEVREEKSFLRFLVLHELAHLLNNWGQEQEQDCNEWAFERLGWK